MELSRPAAVLQRKRGDQRVSFDHVADHLVDFAERNPDQAQTMADLAEFLAAIEDVEHDHSAGDEAGTEIAQEE